MNSKLYIDKNKTYTYTHHKGMAPLLHAASFGKEKTCQYLINNGCNAMVSSEAGKNALMIAASYGRLPTVKSIYNTLISKISDQEMSKFVNQSDSEGETAYITACKRRDRNMIKFLIDTCNVDVTKRDQSGKRGSDHVSNSFFQLKSWLNKIEREAE